MFYAQLTITVISGRNDPEMHAQNHKKHVAFGGVGKAHEATSDQFEATYNL